MRLGIMVLVMLALILVVVGLAFLGLAFARDDEGGKFRKYLFMSAALCAFLLAGMAAFAAGSPLIAWLGLSRKAGLFALLGCFFILLIAIGWTYDKLRAWWASKSREPSSR